MEKSGIEELEALNLDWKEDQLLMTISLCVGCEEGDFFLELGKNGGLGRGCGRSFKLRPTRKFKTSSS